MKTSAKDFFTPEEEAQTLQAILEDLAFKDGKVDPPDRLDVAETLRQTPCRDGGALLHGGVIVPLSNSGF